MSAFEPVPAFDIVPVERADIPRMAYIHAVSCMADAAFGLYFASQDEFAHRIDNMLQGQIGEPGWHHVKAVDRATGTLTAWSSWFTPTEDWIRQRDAKALETRKAQASAERAATKEKQSDGSTKPAKGGFAYPPGLGSYVSQQTSAFLADLTCNRRHTTLMGLFTDPPFQKQGLGNRLVKHAVRKADEATLPMVLFASASGYPRYKSNGFHVVGQLDLDLTRWAPETSGNDGDRRNYSFRYMIRLPEIV